VALFQGGRMNIAAARRKQAPISEPFQVPSQPQCQ
jgi:hypothetical protein